MVELMQRRVGDNCAKLDAGPGDHCLLTTFSEFLSTPSTIKTAENLTTPSLVF
jgi:hypothetical protein